MKLTIVHRLAAALALLLSLAAAPAAAEHPNDDPVRALPFTGRAGGDIEGAPPMLAAGRFAFYTFQYPGDGSTLTVEAEITPGDPVSASRAGVSIYGPTAGKLYATAGQTGTHPSHRAEFSSSEAGTYVLQVFNYNVTPIRYDVAIAGLPPQPSPTPLPTASEPTGAQPTPTPTPLAVGENTTAERAIVLSGPVEGTLRGDPAGSFHFYRFDYPGDGSAVRLDLSVDPPDAGPGLTSGAIVYGPTAGREYLRAGFENRPSPQSGTFRSTEAGTYLVQVASYGPRPIRYRLEVTAGG